MKHKTPVALIILDGYGYSPTTKDNAIYSAQKPHLDAWMTEYPHTLLDASGPAVGLLPGIIGNSEVGHLTIGAGRVIPQPITVIHHAIEDKSFFSNPTLIASLQKIKKAGTALHIMGLLSDAGVHSDIEHIYAYLDVAHRQGINYVFIHAFLDGRDTPPRSAATYLEPLDRALSNFEYGSIASLHGRFYAMDRDANWDRTKKSYDVLAFGEPCNTRAWEDILKENYAKGVTDEFIQPVQLDPTSTIEMDDGVIFINFRPDRARQLTECFVNPGFDKFPVKKLALSCFVTPRQYAPKLSTDALFKESPVKNTLKEVLSDNGNSIFSIAETEKYAHVTYFFNGGDEKPVPHETRVLIPSIRTKTYIEHPEMSAAEITAAVLKSLAEHPSDFYLINYANADMVGHSGDFDATVKAIEILDAQLALLYDAFITQHHGTLFITADHGKAEVMFDTKHKQPNPAHTTSKVPFLMITSNKSDNDKLSLTTLSDIAPFILKTMGLPVPPEMKKK